VQALLEQGSWLHPTDTLETALPLFDQLSLGYLPVARPSQGDGPPDLIGTIDHIDALKAYNRALAATAREEHS
ncbi:MAG: chloride channel protein, partial [Pseudomonadota bacterium]